MKAIFVCMASKLVVLAARGITTFFQGFEGVSRSIVSSLEAFASPARGPK